MFDKLYENLVAVTESYSRDKCMDCSLPPEVEVQWAEGIGHCWFCMKHFKKWATTGDGQGDVYAVKNIQDGKAAKKWKDNTSPNIMSSMKFLKEATYLQDMGLAGFIYSNGSEVSFNPAESEHESHPDIDKLKSKKAMEYRIFPAGISSDKDVLILRLRGDLTSSQIHAVNKILADTDYTIENVEVSLLDSPDWIGRKDARFGMSKYWPSTVRKMYEAAVATQVDPQKALLKKWGSATQLKKSTWPGNESEWYKFWMLTDGKLIAVPHSHDETARKAISQGGAFQRLLGAGAIRGYIDASWKDAELNIMSDVKLTSRQIVALTAMHSRYHIERVAYDRGGYLASSKEVKSADELNYFLNYGDDSDVNEAKEATDKEKLDYYLKRTETHIGLVQGAATKIEKAFPEEFFELTVQVEIHDDAKLKEPEMTPYIAITWRHKIEKESGKFDPIKGKGYQTPGKLEKKEEDEATLHHIKNSSHHPEFWLDDKTKANIGTNRDDSIECVDASKMPDMDVAEMVADWQAMSEELKTNTAREWFEKVKDVRWHFSEKQEELIDRLLKVFEGSDDKIKEASGQEAVISTTTDSFGKKLWKVSYVRCGKNNARTFYSEAEAENFATRGVPMLVDEPVCQPKKQLGRDRTVPRW